MVMWRYTPFIWSKGQQICGVVEIYSGYLKQSWTNACFCGDIRWWFETMVNKYMVLWRYTPDILNKGKQIHDIVKIYSRCMKQTQTNTWWCVDILRLFETKLNKHVELRRYTTVIWNKGKKHVVLWRYTLVIWYKGKQIRGVVEIYSRYLKKKINKYVVVWRYTPFIWKKDKQICGIVEIYSRYLKKT